MNNYKNDRREGPIEEPEYLFWETELYHKSFFKAKKNKKFIYYDGAGAWKYLFYHWLNKWVKFICAVYAEPYMYHPLPVSDQILYWQPIFSKHVSDGLIKREEAQMSKRKSRRARRTNRSILLRALFRTIWKRGLFLVIGLIIVNLLSMSIAILVKKLLQMINNDRNGFILTFLLLVAIVVCQIIDGLLVENINFYLLRLNCIVHYLFSINIFEHGMCHRRKFANDINGTNALKVCNQVLHSCDPESECMKNPLFCQALRYQNKDVNSQMYSFAIIDSYYIAQSLESFKYIIEFVTNFGYGIFLLSFQVKMELWVLYSVGVFFLFSMILIEILNAYLFNFILYLRDYKITKCNNITLSLSLVKKMFYDDIALNIITQSRNNELSLFFIRMLLTLFNMTLYNMCVNITFYMIQRYFVKSLNETSDIIKIDTAGFMATFYIFLRIIDSMFLIPMSIRMFGMGYASFKRINRYIKDCSPNFYIADNRFTGTNNLDSVVSDTTSELPKDAVVYYKEATFSWVNSCKDLASMTYEQYLKKVNFELKRGEIAIITGVQGSGKSNFIKSILGEMTLVGGSMAVVPLHTSMPIFYASQDIWLQHGTIRSNITFGYRFDEQLYNTVLSAVELDYDISTWEKGDRRVLSDNAHSLSGGQRVRMELARAVYAYLVFHKVNTEYNNSQCSFLMCLDASFNSLDPYVSKNIFNNLFNVKTGLLMKGDLSVVLTSSYQTLVTTSKLSDLKQVPSIPIYNIKNRTLKFYADIHDFVKKNRVNINGDSTEVSPVSNGEYLMNYLTNDMINRCNSDSITRSGRVEQTISKYSRSFKTYVKNELSGIKFNPYVVYMKPALPTFLIYILLNIALNIMNNLKYVFATNVSYHITKNIQKYKNGISVDMFEIRTYSKYSLYIVLTVIIITIMFSLLSSVLFSVSCIISSRKIHEYVVDSIFKNSSSVIKIKRDISQIITSISCDMYVVDEEVGYYLSLCYTYLIQTLIHIVTLFYLIPISIPFVISAMLFVYFCVLKRYIHSSKNIHFAYLETCFHLNSVLENAITGSSIYRSYGRNSDLLTSFMEHREYKARCKFVLYSLVSWSSILFNWIFSYSTLLILILLITLDKFTKIKLKVGYFLLALSLSLSVVKSFEKFSSIFSKFEIAICSVERFQYFIPPGMGVEFDKFLNTHEEYVVNPTNKDVKKVYEGELIKRRAAEFESDNKKFYGLRKLFYHPKLTILDVDDYLTHKHAGVELEDVSVYTSSIHNPEGMILKNITVSAHKSEIIGMVGRTGAGKTTLLSVLQNIAENRTGQVLLDGKDLNDIPKVVLRQIIGVIPQLPFVFKGWTIRRFLDPRKLFSDDEIKYALSSCGLLKFVNELPGGKKLDTVLVPEEPVLYYLKSKTVQFIPTRYDYDTSIYNELAKPAFDSDMLLSYNQLRTLSLARLVLYRDLFRIILVDEPPENSDEQQYLDNDTETNGAGVPIYQLLKMYFQHCTTFVTAHNANVLKTCTSVWVIHDGCLVRTIKTSDIAADESIASIIGESITLN
ncbi:uncharacterized protein TOT_020000006 [Theileria orientalis strain Shintoku]|uniref:ABC transporter n=1 Tax=Theileria orientalis strain Shintoku TaxID=869250 RepID=J4C7W2_THEOR|nr:uncharacterized protein TOT_020000006 [Theileria orientalis strain Shintoku]BAM39733.1 uncharacterized protein TOT_020000006 [Theileria orientalis strain Shintoku]|eukprot:XP_009690034.1 uncharacterized protein TOT_020000006 [Theileria orientalis strain Shintoku]